MNRNQLIQYTKTLIDEVSPVNGLEDDIVIADFGEDKPVDDFVESLLDESATETQLLAPTYYLNSSDIDFQNVRVSDGVGEVDKPKDFLKITRFKLHSWERPVNVSVSEGSPLANVQGNKYLRGGKAKPIVVEERDYLRIYPVSLDDIDADNNLEYAKNCVAEQVNGELQVPMCWLTASKVLSVVGNMNGAKNAKDRFVELIQGVKRRVV